ncbi:MAG TPA: methyltransferase domain-containing protein [Bryobacteraceae bacterium]|nr:methyltransferase domain-containing protein [Bryobacteraceae bacterium]
MPRDWDQHYSNAANLELLPAPLLVEAAGLLPPGRALDIASGPGRNALYLASLGWKVTAVDSSPVAISILRRRAVGLAVDVRRANLEAGEFQILPEAYDLICDFFYLQRRLFPHIREGVRLGGVFAAAIHLVDDTPGLRPRNPAYLMQPGELRAEFAAWKILYYSEGAEPDRTRRVARILARRA